MLYDFRTRLQAQTDPLPTINESAAESESAAETREGMELNGNNPTTPGAETQQSCCPYVPEDVPATIAPELRTLIPSELAEAEYWTRVHAQVDALLPPQTYGPMLENLDLYADAAVALALTRVFSFAVKLPAAQYERLTWTFAAEVALAKLRRMA